MQAAYFLQCCLSSPVPQGIASLSLQLVYSKVEKLYLCPTGRSLAERSTPNGKQREEAKRLLVSFLYLHSLLQPGGGKGCSLERLCQEILETLPVCLPYLTTKGGQSWDGGLGREGEHGSLLPDQIIFQMVILCILNVRKLKLQGELELSETATTFSLNFFAQVVHCGSLRLQAALQNQLIPGAEDSEESRGPLGLRGERAAELRTAKEELEPSDFSQSAGKHPFFPLLPGDPTDFWEPSLPNQEEVSDLDGNCDSYNALDVSAEWADISFSSLPDGDEDLNPLFCGGKPSETLSGATCSLSSSRTLDKSRGLQEKLDAFCGEGLLPTLKVIVQWLRTHPDLITLSMHTCPGLWSDLLVA
uniref:Uncharacterized protein n=1 Tax=Monodelphis domestica TaxID=13616 RepID=F7CJD7_MONDO